MEIKKIVPLIISSILLANLISLAQPGNPYTILIYVNLYGSPVSNATVIVTELATNESRNATQTNPGIYGINLGNFGLGWHVGDNVLIEVFYEEYYAKNIIVLTDEGYSIVNISLRNNTSPVANDDYYSTNEDVKLVISAPGILANDSDADGDNLTAELVTNPSNGSLTLNSNGSFVYTPSLNYYGSDSFTYKANDGISDSNIATVYITISSINDAPVAVDDYTSLYEDNSIIISILSNDYDIDGTINESSVRIIQNASYGSLIINPNGTVTYTPLLNYYGNDFFKYRFMDNSNSWSNIATVYINITPVNDSPCKPSLLNPENNSINVSINATLIAHVIDMDNDIMTVKFYGRKLGATWQLIGTKTNVENNSDTSITWYNLEYNTTYEWYAIANDSISENISDIWRFKTELSTINTPPVANNDYYSTGEDIALIINAPGILANDSDVDNDSLTAILLNNPSNGSIVLNSNGSFVYTPSFNYYGSDSFTYKANDGISDSNIATVYITINSVNDEPIANFNFYPENPIVGQTIYFNSTSYDIDGGIINWTWNFDNFFAYEENTTYIYSEAGKHNVTLTVKDTDGATVSIVKEVIVQISDNIPPTTTLGFGLPYYYDGTKEWITSSTLITLSASDEVSGVDRTYYYIDDLPAIEYSEPFTVSAGMHTIYYYSIDKLGNVETTKSTVVYVDNIPPEIILNVGEPKYNQYVKSITQFNITANDEGCGLMLLEYRIWYGSWSDWQTENFTLQGEGLHYIEIRAIDNLGNTAIDNLGNTAYENKTYYVDNIPPTSRVDEIIPYEQEEIPFNVTVVEIEDHGAEISGPVGVCKVEVYYSYSENNITWSDWQLYTTFFIPYEQRLAVPDQTFSFNAPEGIAFYRFISIAYDCLGNKETPPYYHGTYDAECFFNASIFIKFGSPRYGEWISPLTPINISMNREGNIYYRIYYNGWHPGDGFYLYSGNFTINFSGTCYIEFYGEALAIKNATVKVDAFPPETFISSEFFVVSPLVIECNAYDNESGLKCVEFYYQYSYDNLTWIDWRVESIDYSFPYTCIFNEIGFYKISTVGIDNVDNYEEIETKAFVRIFNPDFNNDGFINVQDLVIIARNFNGSDAKFDINGDATIDLNDTKPIFEIWHKR